jgi:hypothetical protein
MNRQDYSPVIEDENRLVTHNEATDEITTFLSPDEMLMTSDSRGAAI